MPKKATAPTGQSQTIVIPEMIIAKTIIKLVGDSPLIVHAWSPKVIQEMLDKQMKKAKPAGREAKCPEADFCDSLYWLEGKPEVSSEVTEEDLKNGRYGFPATAFKSTAVDACSSIEGITKVQARGAFHIVGDMVEIKGVPVMRQDTVKIAMGTADIRHRAEFREWTATFMIRYNPNVLSLAQIANLFNMGGFSVGVGEWRPQRDGMNGMFHVATEGE